MERYGRNFNTLTKTTATFDNPLKWNEPRKIFVCSWSDFFHGDVPDKWRNEAWGIMRDASQHTYMLLTKRPKNILRMLPRDWSSGWQHAWIGVTVESQKYIARTAGLYGLGTTTFVSAEPLLGQLDFNEYMGFVDWVIAGCESGAKSKRRKTEIDWLRDLRNQCLFADVPFFLKQMEIDGHVTKMPLLDGKVHDSIPDL